MFDIIIFVQYFLRVLITRIRKSFSNLRKMNMFSFLCGKNSCFLSDCNISIIN